MHRRTYHVTNARMREAASGKALRSPLMVALMPAAGRGAIMRAGRRLLRVFSRARDVEFKRTDTRTAGTVIYAAGEVGNSWRTRLSISPLQELPSRLPSFGPSSPYLARHHHEACGWVK